MLLQLVALLLETRDLSLVLGERSEVDPLRIHRADEVNAVAPCTPNELGRYLLVQDAQDGGGDRADLIARQCVALHLARTLDVDPCLLRRRTHCFVSCRITGTLRRVVVAHQIDAVRLDDLGRGICAAGDDGEHQRTESRAQDLF